jgi:hypothetical protein
MLISRKAAKAQREKRILKLMQTKTSKEEKLHPYLKPIDDAFNSVFDEIHIKINKQAQFQAGQF